MTPRFVTAVQAGMIACAAVAAMGASPLSAPLFAPYSATLSTPAPQPTKPPPINQAVPPPFHFKPNANILAPLPGPSGLATTQDPNTCGQHTVLFCVQGFQTGQLLLVWDWNGPSADGFNVYRVDGGRRDRIASPSSFATGYFLAVPPGGFNGKCYAVTARGNNFETAASNRVCVGSINVARTIEYSLVYARSNDQVHLGQGGLAHHDAVEDQDYAALRVGYEFKFNSPSIGPDDFTNSLYALGAYFGDLPETKNRSILNATLKLRVGTSYTVECHGGVMHGGPPCNGTFTQEHIVSCLYWIDAGRDYWWTHNDRILGERILQVLEQTGPDTSYDVTQIVRSWQLGRQNFGFVLEGYYDNNLAARDNNRCFTDFDDIKLDVTYAQ
jgi:hypothetical protein